MRTIRTLLDVFSETNMKISEHLGTLCTYTWHTTHWWQVSEGLLKVYRRLHKGYEKVGISYIRLHVICDLRVKINFLPMLLIKQFHDKRKCISVKYINFYHKPEYDLCGKQTKWNQHNLMPIYIKARIHFQNSKQPWTCTR